MLNPFEWWAWDNLWCTEFVGQGSHDPPIRWLFLYTWLKSNTYSKLNEMKLNILMTMRASNILPGTLNFPTAAPPVTWTGITTWSFHANCSASWAAPGPPDHTAMSNYTELTTSAPLTTRLSRMQHSLGAPIHAVMIIERCISDWDSVNAAHSYLKLQT